MEIPPSWITTQWMLRLSAMHETRQETMVNQEYNEVLVSN